MEQLHFPGEIIAQRYRIVGRLGQGGRGTTYQAQELQTGQLVALKALPLRSLKGEKALALVEREARILFQLNHPAIPPYLDYFYSDTRQNHSFYIVQQFAPGQSFAALVQNGWHGNERKVRRIAVQILDILVYLHDLTPPVIHQDIKPHNLIRLYNGQVCLVDFGTVQYTYYNTFAPSSSEGGTFGYTAPEQLLGQAVPATDLYGLGATLLFLLTHRSPADWPTDTLKIDMRSHVQMSKEFGEWLGKMLELEVVNRFSSAKAALANLPSQRIISAKSIMPARRSCICFLKVTIAAVAGAIAIYSYKYPILSTLIQAPSGIYEAAAKGDLVAVRTYLKRGTGINTRKSDGTTALHWAGSLEVAQLLIAEGADVNAQDRYGWTPLHYTRSLAVAQLLIANGADVNAKSQQHLTPFAHISWIKSQPEVSINHLRQGITPLHVAPSQEIAQLLIANGADINAKTEDGIIPLQLVKSKEVAEVLLSRGVELEPEAINLKYFWNKHYRATLLHRAATIGSQQMAQMLLAKGANILALDSEGQTPLHLASSKEVAQLLITDVNVTDNLGRTPLSTTRSLEVMSLLIAHGADVNAKDNSGNTLLHAILTSSEWHKDQKDRKDEQGFPQEAIKFLIANGADVNAKDNLGNTPLHYAISRYENQGLVELLLAKGAEVNTANNYGETPLHQAAWNRPKFVNLLISHGAIINVRDKYGKTPLHRTGIQSIALFLVVKGADVDAKDNQGQTPIHKAVRNNWQALVELLLATGVDINVRDNEGKTPLCLAEQKEMKKLLKNHGAVK
ncbi:MAG TPA: serine/threonine protein kinase [Cyanobacteria bacterium UBA8803]|nr:serine/threonine protein kinase [Cyanobacteria bacterium UBA9273]HBL62478.1 serine/threonine protein kinase [Cyanobacteria bacterium UBA8803]